MAVASHINCIELCYYIILGPCLDCKFFTLFPSHQIFGHMHGVLNIDKKITNYTV